MRALVYLPLLFLLLLPPTLSQTPPSPIRFLDFSRLFGFQHLSEQFGGATIADLDNDGNYDFILTYHNLHPMRIYFGDNSTPGDYKLIRSPFALRNDIHGVSVAPRTATSMDKLMCVAVGGGRGTNLRPPFMYLIQKNRTIETVTDRFGFGQERTRGRVPVWMDMGMRTRMQKRRNGGGDDLLVVNFLGNVGEIRHFAYENVRGSFELREVPGFTNIDEERAIVTDVDGDGIMEVVHFSVLRIFKLTAPFTFQDVTSTVWPGVRNLQRSIAAITELDYNNDGRMDLYIARAQSALVTPRGPRSVPERGDVLLENRGGFYVEVDAAAAGIPQDTDSMGVTTGDFDNNGYTDVLITTFEGPDVLLMNTGQGRFERTDPGSTKNEGARGANIMAVDYDGNGAVDYVVGQGLRREFFGNFRLMRSLMQPGTAGRNYLLVRVGFERTNAGTALNAMVTVFLRGGKRMVRRVGGRGAALGGQSFLDTVHFGLGNVDMVRRVTARWTTGAVHTVRNVAANQKIQLGLFN